MLLSPREMEALQGLANGHTINRMSISWGVSPNTVKKHIRNLYDKLDAVSAAHAVANAFRTGVLDNPDVRVVVVRPGDILLITKDQR
jgi:DNA-binding CsgD family transcriptional regulator